MPQRLIGALRGSLKRGKIYKLSFESMVEDRWCIISIKTSNGRSERMLVPVLPGVTYLVRPDDDVSISEASEALSIDVAPLKSRIALRVRMLRGGGKKKQLSSQLITLFPEGSSAAVKRFRQHMRQMLDFQVKFPACEALTLEPYLGWPRQVEQEPTHAVERIIVVVHLYYLDLWPEFQTILSRWTVPFDLIVTISSDAPPLTSARIEAAFPGVCVRKVANIGRDVRPFIELLEARTFDRYDLLCKLHGKKSVASGRSELVGDLWRRRCLFDLADPGQVDRVLEYFRTSERIGMVGPRVFKLPNVSWDEKKSWGANQTTALALGQEMNFSETGSKLDFFAGTMFWVRPAALQPLKLLQLSKRFTAEARSLDGQLEHALERLLPAVVRHTGYSVEDI